MEWRFPEPVEAMLRAAGWHQGHQVALACSGAMTFQVFARAEEVLREFGGLHIGACGPGSDCARSDVRIHADGMGHLTPTLAEQEALLQTRLCPIGSFQHEHGHLIIDSEGRIYTLSAVSGEFRSFAPTFSDALESLLLGIKIAPKEEPIAALFERLAATGLMSPWAETESGE